jgi:hypothetical protein
VFYNLSWVNYEDFTNSLTRICSINSIRNTRHSFADNRSKNNIYQNQASRGTNAGANFIQSQHFMSKIVVRSEWCNFSRQFHVFLHRVCIFQLYLEFVWRNSIFLVKSLLIYDSRSILKCSHGAFETFIQENGVSRGKLQLLGFFH